MAARRHDHRRPLADPHVIGDVFANGIELQDFEDWVRMVFAADHAENWHPTRRKVAAIVLPRSALPLLLQLVRESFGGHRDARRH